MARGLTKRKPKKEVKIPRKSSKLAEEKHVGLETTNWSEIDDADFDTHLRWTLRHYGYFYDIKDAFKWAAAWVKKTKDKETYKKFRASPERNFSMTAGGLCRIIENGGKLREKQMALLEREVAAAVKRGERALSEDEEGPKVNIMKKSPMDIVKERTSDFIGEIEEVLDLFGTKVWVDWEEYSVYNELQKIDAPYNIAKGVSDYYTPIREELTELVEKKTADLVEAYDHLGPRKRKQLLKVVEQIVDDAERYMISKKAVRKPRKKKATSAGQQVAKLKYLKESAEFKLTSIDPTNIVGATEVYLFNTKYRQMHYLVSSAKAGFEVKGTTIQNVDLEASYKKTIRKPEEFMTDFIKSPKVKSRRALDDLKTKGAPTNGRVNDQTLILKVYS